MGFHYKKSYTYVFTYTISNNAVAEEYLAFLKAKQKDDGLEAEDNPIDQSTYGTKLSYDTLALLRKLHSKLTELYNKHHVSLSERKDDKATLMAAASYFPKLDTQSNILLFDVFDFE